MHFLEWCGPPQRAEYADESPIYDHIFMDFLAVLYKMSIFESVRAVPVVDRMWDADELREVDDVIGYQLYPDDNT